MPMKMHDVRKKPMETAKPMDEYYYPSLHLTSKQFPPASKIKFGQEVTMVIKGKVKSISQDRGESSSFSIDIMKIGMAGQKEK